MNVGDGSQLNGGYFDTDYRIHDAARFIASKKVGTVVKVDSENEMGMSSKGSSEYQYHLCRSHQLLGLRQFAIIDFCSIFQKYGLFL